MLNTPSGTAMVANIYQHARYIKANIRYIRLQLRQHGERLSSAGDMVTPYQLRRGWVQQPAGPAGRGGECVEEGSSIDAGLCYANFLK